MTWLWHMCSKLHPISNKLLKTDISLISLVRVCQSHTASHGQLLPSCHYLLKMGTSCVGDSWLYELRDHVSGISWEGTLWPSRRETVCLISAQPKCCPHTAPPTSLLGGQTWRGEEEVWSVTIATSSILCEQTLSAEKIRSTYMQLTFEVFLRP